MIKVKHFRFQFSKIVHPKLGYIQKKTMHSQKYAYSCFKQRSRLSLGS